MARPVSDVDQMIADLGAVALAKTEDAPPVWLVQTEGGFGPRYTGATPTEAIRAAWLAKQQG